MAELGDHGAQQSRASILTEPDDIEQPADATCPDASKPKTFSAGLVR